MSRRGIAVGTIATMALALITLISTGIAHASTIVTINAQSGTHTEQAHSGTNYCGNSTELANSSSTAGKRGYNAFTTAVPAGNHITAATLQYYSHQTSATNVNAYKQTTWTGFPGGCSLTWANQPAQGTLLGSSSGGQTLNAYNSIAVSTSLVPLSGTFGVMLNSQGTSDLGFDYDGTTHPPKLVVTYTPDVVTPPTVTTGSATGVGGTTATLNGTVNPNGAATTYHFEYGPTTAYGTSVPVPDGSAGSGSVAVNESANLTGLTVSTLYHFRLDATNSGGTSNGTDGTFTTTAATCTGVAVAPTDDLQAKINANPTGTTFCLSSGTHRPAAQGGYTPLANDVIQGVGTGVIVSGGKVVTGFAASGSDFVATGFLPATQTSGGTCLSTAPLCGQAEDVFLDGTWLTPVTARASLAAGKAFLDYPNNKIYIRDNPSGHTVEQSWARHLFTGSATGVTIKNLNIEHAASLSNTGVIDPAAGGTGWTIDHNDIRWNHGYGTGPGNAAFGQAANFTITANHVHNNGQDGTGADGNGNTVSGNEVDHNSYAGYDVLWDGGNKFGHAGNLVVTGNYYHDERGPAIWCDINCSTITVTNNYISNAPRGIMFEISCGASIHDNTIVNMADPDPNSWDGIGILIAESQDATVYSNSIYGNTAASRGVWAIQQDRTEARDCTGGTEHVVKNLNVHDNSEDLNGAAPRFGGMTGLWTDTGRTDIYGASFGNGFTHDTYHQSTALSQWDWGVTTPPYTNTISFSAWQGLGQDTTGSVVADDPAAPSPPTLTTGPQ